MPQPIARLACECRAGVDGCSVACAGHPPVVHDNGYELIPLADGAALCVIGSVSSHPAPGPGPRTRSVRGEASEVSK